MDNLARARQIIELDGDDGYRSAANIVGPDEADKLLADLVARNMGTTPDNEEVRTFVAEVRVRKGFAPGFHQRDDVTSTTINDVLKAVSKAQDIMVATSTVREHLRDDEYTTRFGDEWHKTFMEKSNLLVQILNEELGEQWHRLPRTTTLGQRAQVVFAEVLDLLK